MEYISMVIIAAAIGTAGALECYTCSSVNAIYRCNNTQTCTTGQSCFQDKRTNTDGILLTLGCIDNQMCGSHVHTGGFGSIIGRSLNRRQVDNCHECCSTDLCNAQLCSHENPSACVDEETIDCAQMNTLIDLCKDIHHAKNICPKFCGLCSLVDGNWSGWTTWGTCDVTCSNGTRIRTRICSNPAPQNGGLDCQGQNTDQKSCFKDVCPIQGGWSTWSDWGTCSATCDVGISRRERSCSNPYPSKFGDHCFGLNVDDRLCMPGQCADGGWTSWETWGVCSVTCGLGIRSRARWCRNPEPSPYGRDCQGVPQEVETCHDRNCKTLTDCYDIMNYDRMATSGVYDITTWKTHSPVSVYCDMTTDGGRWTVFQYRFNGSEDFFRNFSDYENGFGKLDGEFWLGLKYIQELADQGDTELRVDLEAANGDKAYETLAHFSLSARPSYTLHVGSVIKSHGMSGAGVASHNGLPFSTFDHDVDRNASNCALDWHGAWWYNACYSANLNGQYLNPDTYSLKGMVHLAFKGYHTLKSTKLMLRRN